MIILKGQIRAACKNRALLRSTDDEPTLLPAPLDRKTQRPLPSRS